MKTIIPFLLGVFLTSHVVAGTYTLTPQATDGYVDALDQIYSVTGITGTVGLASNDGFGRATVFVFSMPKIPFGEYISGANLNLFLGSITGTPTFNGDLTSLGVSTSPSVLGTDYFNGTYGTAPNSTPIQQHFITPGTAAGYVSATSAGNAAIAADLDGYYADGNPEASYYFLRLNPDVTTLSSASLCYNLGMTEESVGRQPSLTVQTSSPPQMGRVLFEYWTGLTSGTSCDNLTNTTLNPNWPKLPTAREYSTVMEIPVNMGVNSGDRMRCYFYPPVTGSYTFAVASDNDSMLLFSADGTVADATQIASVTGTTTGYQQWNATASQTSAPIYLTAGQACYIESRHMEGTSTSNFSIGWNPPAGVAGSGSMELMPTTYCAPYDPGANYTSGAIVNYVRALNHPRLMISPAAIARMASEVTVGTPQYDSVQAGVWASIKGVVTGTVTTGTPEGSTLAGPLIGATVTPPSSGNFLTGAGTLEDRIYYLALFYQLESVLNPSDPNIQGAVNQVYAELANAATWGSGKGGWAEYQFLDLPNICHAFAIGYDWCYSGLTPTQRTNILGWIVNQGLVPGITAYNNRTIAQYWWVDSTDNNWTTVCDAGLSFCALSVLNDETSSPQAPTVLDDYIPELNATTWGEWNPDGGWAEGLSYWNFCARYMTTYFSCLETSAATCYNQDTLPGLSSMGSFLVYGTGPTGNAYNFSDGGDGPLVGPYWGPWCRYLGLKYNQPIYSYFESSEHSSRFPTDMVWRDKRLVPPGSTTPLSNYNQTVGTIFLRSAWNNSNAIYAGIKAGFNANVTPYGSGHENEEIGSFVFEALDVRWFVDLGSDNYNLNGYFTAAPTTSPNRWQYYRKRAEGNNTLVINPSANGGQYSYGYATITNFKTSATLQQAIIDMTGAYSMTDGNPTNAAPSTTLVTSAKRGFRILNGTMQLQDEITTSSAVDLNSFLHTSATIDINNSTTPPTALLSTGTNYLQVALQSPSGAIFKSMAATPLPTSPDYATYKTNGELANTGVNKLWIEFPASGTTTVTLGFSPYVTNSPPPAPPPVTPLSSW